HQDAAVATPRRLEQRERHQGGLAGTGRRREHDVAATRQGGEQGRNRIGDGQIVYHDADRAESLLYGLRNEGLVGNLMARMIRHARTASCGLLAGLLLGIGWLAPAMALESAPVSSARATATLVSETDAVAPGTSFRVGLRLRLAPGWHTYW